MKNIFISIIFISGSFLFSQENKDEDWYYNEADKAIFNENYEYAVSVLEEGRSFFPESYKIIEKQGDLYFDKELYSMALKAYKEGELLEPDNGAVIYKIGSTLGRLNENNEAILYFEKLIKYEEYNRLAVDDLSWLYYKVHRLKDSEKLLLEEMAKYFHRNLAITLGTVYSDMYNYEKSKEFYLLSIEDAQRNNREYFASVALYNLSLLEFSFYNYDQALQYTGDSLGSKNRSPGHLARGEIFQLAGRFREAEKEYLEAESMDETPLARISLAGLYQKTGHLEKALAYLNDVLARRDMSWMYFFGIDKIQYKMDLSKPLSDIYKGLAEKEGKILHKNPFEWFKGKISQVKYRVLSYYHYQIYRKSARKVGDNTKESSDLNSWWAYSRASQGNTSTFLKYINMCETFERELTTKSVPWYLLERGRETKNYNLLNEALSMFRTNWEVEPIIDSLKYLIPMEYKRDKVSGRMRLNQLYELNRGALIQNGFSLPLILEHNGTGSKRKLRRYLKKTGSEVVFEQKEGFRYKLIVSILESEYSWYLLEPDGKITFTAKGSYDKLNNSVYKEIINSFFESTYSYDF